LSYSSGAAPSFSAFATALHLCAALVKLTRCVPDPGRNPCEVSSSVSVEMCTTTHDTLHPLELTPSLGQSYLH
jgi:hypothetical protein